MGRKGMNVGRLGCFAGALLLPAPVLPAFADETGSTLYGGNFDERLMLAADHDAGMLSGYYRDGACRFVFRDALKPVMLYQRSDLGEAYQATAWEPGHPDQTFTVTLYSTARKGFSGQITIEPGEARHCRWRISLDRGDWVSSAFVGVRVIARSHVRLFDMLADGPVARAVQTNRDKAPPRGSGAWVAKTYGPVAPGYVYLNWYGTDGRPHAGYVRERDLDPLPPPVDDGPAGTSLEG